MSILFGRTSLNIVLIDLFTDNYEAEELLKCQLNNSSAAETTDSEATHGHDRSVAITNSKNVYSQHNIALALEISICSDYVSLFLLLKNNTSQRTLLCFY